MRACRERVGELNAHSVFGKKILHLTVGLFFFQAEDGIRDAQESRGLGDVYKRQVPIILVNKLIGEA